MGMSDAYMDALKSKRGKSLDPAMITMGNEESPSVEISEHSKPQDVRMGFQAALPSGTAELGEMDAPHTAINDRAGMDKEAALAHPKDHYDEHTPVKNENHEMDFPAMQSVGKGGGELGNEIRDYVGGHASQSEYDLLKDIKPRSLGERAKMEALKQKYSLGKGE